MIDINELRKLLEAATPGPRWVNQDGLNHGFERGVLEVNAKDWHALAGAWAINGAKPSEEGAANAAFIAAANPAAITEILDRLETAEKERDELRARVEQLEKALAFYADETRYHGPNQLYNGGDSWTDNVGLCAYRLDVTRDYGCIARSTLGEPK